MKKKSRRKKRNKEQEQQIENRNKCRYNPTMPGITLNINVPKAPVKRDQQSGSRDKTQLYGVYKNHILHLKTYMD